MNFKHVGCDIDYDLETETINGKRFYKTPEGNLYPSVTTITSQHGKDKIIEWRKRVGEEEANKISNKASTRGTKIHTLTETYLKNENVSDKIDEVKASMLDVEMFNKFKPILDPISNIHCQELALYSDHLRMAGRVDCIAEYDGKRAVIDFKTSNKSKSKSYIESYFMQTAAYAIMYEERTGIPVPWLVILIAVEDDAPQVFIEKRDDWVKKLLRTRDYYENGYYTSE
jgi:CRISPR/Cas system-associated exonuclease Cas4 (RecB family)